MLNKESVVVEYFSPQHKIARDMFAESTDISRVFMCCKIGTEKNCNRTLSRRDFGVE
jgi:hypothetical protein